MKRIQSGIVVLGLILAPMIAAAQSDRFKPSPPDRPTQFERNQRNAQEVYERQRRERSREQMRDKSHDFPRVKTGKNSSVGVDPTKREINIRRTY